MARRGRNNSVVTPEVGEKIAELREAGRSVGFIARRLGVSHGAVSWYCLRQGVEPPKPRRLDPVPVQPVVNKRGNHVVRKFTQAEDALLVKLDMQGFRPSIIAKMMGRRSNSIAGRLASLARRDARAEMRP